MNIYTFLLKITKAFASRTKINVTRAVDSIRDNFRVCWEARLAARTIFLGLVSNVHIAGEWRSFFEWRWKLFAVEVTSRCQDLCFYLRKLTSTVQIKRKNAAKSFFPSVEMNELIFMCATDNPSGITRRKNLLPHKDERSWLGTNLNPRSENIFVCVDTSECTRVSPN